MGLEPEQDTSDQAAAPRGGAPRALLFAGVAAACVLGVGFGLWARPAADERRIALTAGAHVQPAPPRPVPALQIIVDDAPAPIGKPLEVMAPHTADAPAAVPAPVMTRPAAPGPAELMAPVRPPAGLVRVQSIAPAAEPSAVERAAAQAHADAQAAAEKAAAEKAARAERLAIERARAEQQARAEKAEKARLAAKAEAAAEQHRLALAEARKAKLVKAKAEAAKKAELLREAKAELATEEAAKAHKRRLATLVHNLAQAAAHKKQAEQQRLAEARAARKAAELAEAKAEKAESARRAKAERARIEKAAAVRREAARPVPAKPAHGAGPLRLAKSGHCASADPGQALVCADPNLGAADRQLARVYRQAEAAGVPAWRLQQQQQRWLAARATAAREAPWAVHDVYVARIAELQDQARNAAGN